MTRDRSHQPSKAELEEPISIDATPDDLGRATVTSMRKAKNTLKAVAGSENRPLTIGDIEIQCYVLEDETRVLSQAGMFRGLSLAKRGGSVAIDGGAQVPRFAASKAIKAHISSDLAAALSTPIEFQPTGGGRTAYGYPAAILVDLCKAVLAARDAGVLRSNQARIADRADLLIRGLATVGIIALVDEATGYEKIRSQRSLAVILEKFIAKELRPWTRTFPYEFYEQICRLKGWPSINAVKRPSVIGKYTNDFVYERLAPGVLAELKRLNPKLPSGARRHRHHQWFTPEHGHPKLREHLAAVVALMKVSSTWSGFRQLLDRAFTKLNTTIPLPLDSDDPKGK